MIKYLVEIAQLICGQMLRYIGVILLMAGIQIMCGISSSDILLLSFSGVMYMIVSDLWDHYS